MMKRRELQMDYSKNKEVGVIEGDSGLDYPCVQNTKESFSWSHLAYGEETGLIRAG
jgi:hypothetical protein